jgi:hypothetical protein
MSSIQKKHIINSHSLWSCCEYLGERMLAMEERMRGKRRGLENVEGSLILRNPPSTVNVWKSRIPAPALRIINVIPNVLQQRKWISSKRAGKGISLRRGCHCQKINRTNNQIAVQRAAKAITNKSKLDNPIKEPP